MKPIAVILPVYNGGYLLKKSVQSVLAQVNVPFDFIICDDCSTDDSYSFLLSIQQLNPAIVLLKNDVNKGLFATLNKLVSVANNDLIHIWSQDDIMKPNCLEETVQFHQQHPFVTMSYSGVDYIDENDNLIVDERIDNTPSEISSQLYAQITNRWGSMPGNIANVTLVKKWVKQCGLFNESLKVSGDLEYWTRLANLGNIGFCNKRLIFLRRHAGQLSRSYKSILNSMIEDIPIHKKLLAMVPPNYLNKATNIWKWRTQTVYFNEMLFLLFKKEFGMFKAAAALINKETFLPLVFCRWCFIRLLRIVKQDEKFYNHQGMSFAEIINTNTLNK